MNFWFLKLIGNLSCLTWFMDKFQWCMYYRSFNSAGRSHASNPSLTSSIHDHQKPLIPSTNSSFHKDKFPSLLIKSSHLTNFGLSSEEFLATPWPCFFHSSPSLSPIRPSKSLLLLSAGSYRNTRDPIGALPHPVGWPVVAYFEANLLKKHPRR